MGSLKEFRNRWFVFGKRHDFKDPLLSNLALDRIENIEDAPKRERYLKDEGFCPKEYFRDMIGVTRDVESPIEHVTFIASATVAPYLRTKPLHQSQKELGILSDGSVLFCIDVILNHELERDLLGCGEGITVLTPDSLVEKLHIRLAEALGKYEKRK